MINEKLSYLRKKRNISQKELADLLKVAPSTISMYENGKRTPNEEVLKRIAGIFNVSIDYLLGYSTIKDSDNNHQDEFEEYLEELRSNPKMRILFDHAKNATKEELSAAIAFFDAINKH